MEPRTETVVENENVDAALVRPRGVADVTFYRLVASQGPFQVFVVLLSLFVWGFALLQYDSFDRKPAYDSYREREIFKKKPRPDQSKQDPLSSIPGGSFDVAPENDAGVPSVFNGSGGNDFTTIQKGPGAQGQALTPVDAGYLDCLFGSCPEDQEIFFTPEEEIVYEANPNRESGAQEFFESQCQVSEPKLRRFLCERGINRGTWNELNSVLFYKRITGDSESASSLKACLTKLIEQYYKDEIATIDRFGRILSFERYWTNVRNALGFTIGADVYLALKDQKQEFWVLKEPNCSSQELPAPDAEPVNGS